MTRSAQGQAEAQEQPIIEEFNLLRAFALLGVLAVHATSEAVATVQKSSAAYPFYVGLNSFAMFCVPAFIFLTGFVLFYNYYRRPVTVPMLKTFYAKRLLQIIVPYLLISLLFFFIRKAQAGDLGPLSTWLPELAQRLLNGTAHTHLYYIFVLIQLYLLFPLLLLLMQRQPSWARWSIALGLAVQWGFYCVNKLWLDVPSKGSVSLAYFAPFMLGAYLGIYPERLRAWFAPLARPTLRAAVKPTIVLWLAWLGATAAYLWLWYDLRTGQAAVGSTWYELAYNLFTMLTILILTRLVFRLYRDGPRLVIGSLQRLAALSFGIYLIHPMLLLLYRAYPPHQLTPMIYHLWKTGGFLFALLGSAVLLAALYRLLPMAWLLFGPRSRLKS